jgi:threonine dehydratase
MEDPVPMLIDELPTVEDVHAARARIADGTLLTPCPPATALAELVPCRLHLKLESLQRTGSFKDRGALNRLLDLSPEQRAAGVVTASAGNHAQAVAYHCGRLGIPATVVMPEHSPLIKVSNTRRYGARVLLSGATLSDGLAEVDRLSSAEGLTVIHAYDDARVIAGQGTVGLELLEQLPSASVVIVPIGGGGLISGIGLALKDADPKIRLIGVEAEVAASALASRRAGRLAHIEAGQTIADGIATKSVGRLTFPLMERLVDDIVTVGEEQIASAVHLLLERQKIVAEGAGAVPLAALLAKLVPLRRDDVAVAVITGGNIDITMVERLIARGLVADGRLARLMVRVPDRPGSLARLTQIVARAGANVLEIAHRRAFGDISVGDVEIVMHLETRGRDHVREIRTALTDDGLVVEDHI